MRLFAVGHRLSLAEGESPEAYEAALRATVEQDVAPHLATDRPNVLVFPESVAFPLVFLGERAASARAQASALEAFSALVVNLVDESNFYAEIAADALAGKLALLAVTDGVWRGFDRTFSGIARDYGVYVVAGVDVGDVEETADPAVVAALSDPARPAGEPVYWVPDGRVYNQAVFYEPTGARIARVHKAYLTDLEVDELQISGGLPEQLGPVDIGGLLSAAAMISRDAWMQDALERQVLRGADVLLQLEAYTGWTVFDDGYAWPPDNLKRSGWAAVQKYPELRAAVAPMYVGNFFDIGFDGQSFAAVDGTPDQPPRALLAQEPDVGWAAIAPWVEADPMVGTLAERRAALTAVGEALLPGGAREGEYRPGTVWVDLDLRADDAYPRVDGAGPGAEELALGGGQTILPHGVGRKRTPAAAVDVKGRIAVAWEDTRWCTGQIMVARSDDAAATWTEPARVQPWDRPQRTPTVIATGDNQFVLAWQETLADGRAEIRVSRTDDGGATWRRPVRIDPDATVEAWIPALTRDPLTLDLHLAFVDARGPDPSWRVYVTRSRDNGGHWSAPVRVDPRERTAETLDTTYTDEWSPAIAASGSRVVVAYTHRHRPDRTEQPSNDVFVVLSDDGGDSWGAPMRLDDGGFPERLAADVAVGVGVDGSWRVLWSSLRGTGYDTDIALATSDGGALAFAPDSDPPRDQWFPALASLPDGSWVAAWQDFRNGSNDIYMSRLDADGFGPAERVDDGGSSAAQSWRPAIATSSGGRVYVIWEDSRTGHAELRLANAKLAEPESEPEPPAR